AAIRMKFSPQPTNRCRATSAYSSGPLSGRDQLVGVDHVLPGGAFVEVAVAGWGAVQGDDRRVDRFGDLDPIVEDRHHQPVVVAHHRTLAGSKPEGFRPAQADPHAKL